MKKLLVILLIFVMAGSSALAQVSGKRRDQDETIIKTVMNYIDGAYSGDAERMAKALHPELTKVMPFTVPQTGKTGLSKMGASQLIEGTRAKMGTLPESERKIKVTVLDVFEDLAAVKVVSARYIDYLQCAKINDEWKIVNVLWKMNPEAMKKQGWGNKK